MIFLHHLPVSASPDGETDLMEARGLLDLVATSPQVKVVSTGHLHHAFQGKMGYAEVLTTPSSAFQYRFAEDMFEHIPPGARIFHLNVGSFRSEVIRLPRLEHPPH